MHAAPDLTLAEALDRLPKVELHCHIEGTLRHATMLDLAARSGRRVPARAQAPSNQYASLDDFLEAFWFGQECLESPADWARLAHESVVDAAAHGVVYRESFFTPGRHLAAGQDLGGIIEGLEAGLAAGEAETGTRVLLIADIDRAYGGEAGLAFATGVAGIVGRGSAPRVIGFGMDSTELGVDHREFEPAYAVARDAGLRITGHLGENGPPSNIRHGIDVLGVERIDHGSSVLDDPSVTAQVLERGLALTVCPQSNVRLTSIVPSMAEHPWPKLAAAGLHLTLNSDDPAFMSTDLGEEYLALAEALGYGFDDMVAISLAGVDATWLPEDGKAALRDRVRAAAAELGPRIAPDA